MKPLIILVDRIGKEGEITISKSDLEKYIIDAYNSGHSDGFSEGYAEGLSKSSTVWPSNSSWGSPYYTTTSSCTLNSKESNDIHNTIKKKRSNMDIMYTLNLE